MILDTSKCGWGMNMGKMYEHFLNIYSRHFKVVLWILQATYAAAMGCWQVDPKLDDREIFVTHLPPKAGTKDWWNFLPCLLKMRYDFLRTRIAAMTLQEGVRFLLGNFGDIDEEQSWRVELFQLKQENNLVFKRLQEDLCFVSIMFLYEVESVKLEVSCHLLATGHSQLCSMSSITGLDFSLFKAMQFSRLD